MTNPSTNDPAVALLGSAMLAHGSAADLAAKVQPGDFADPSHQTIWRAICAVTARGEQPDPVTVQQQIRDSGDLAEANKLQLVGRALVEAVERCPHPLSGPLYARAVVEDAYRRQVESFGTRCAQIAATAPIAGLDANVREWLERLREARTRLTALGLVGDAQ